MGWGIQMILLSRMRGYNMILGVRRLVEQEADHGK